MFELNKPYSNVKMRVVYGAVNEAKNMSRKALLENLQKKGDSISNFIHSTLFEALTPHHQIQA